MDEIIEKAKKLKESLLQTSEFQEYLKLKELMENDSDLKKMRMDIVKLHSEGRNEEKNNLIALYQSNPLVHNYELAKKEIKEILLSIKDIIQN